MCFSSSSEEEALPHNTGGEVKMKKGNWQILESVLQNVQ